MIYSAKLGRKTTDILHVKQLKCFLPGQTLQFVIII